MTYRMADSINPAALPPGMDAYAGYDDGNWPDYQTIAAAHPGAHLLDLTVWLANRGTGIDVEPGDATVAQAPIFVQERLAAGVVLPVVYCPASWSQAVFNAMAAAGIPRNLWRLVSAHYGAGQHICGPGTCGYPQADGTQWIDHGTWDESLLSDGFFGTPTPTKPIIQPPAPKPVPPSQSSEDSTVSILTAPNRVDVFVIGTDQGIYQASANDLPGLEAAGWRRIGTPNDQGKTVSAAWSPDYKTLYLAVHGTNDSLYLAAWTQAGGWTPFGANPHGALYPSVAS
jgi:hypothetical protein